MSARKGSWRACVCGLRRARQDCSKSLKSGDGGTLGRQQTRTPGERGRIEAEELEEKKKSKKSRYLERFTEHREQEQQYFDAAGEEPKWGEVGEIWEFSSGGRWY